MARLQIVLALLCIAFSSSALAQSRAVYPALYDPYMIPSERVPASGCGVLAGFRIVNYLNYAEGPWGNINTDLEIWQWRIGASAETSLGEWSIEVPFEVSFGGILDTVLNPYHDLLGLPSSPTPPLSEIVINLNGQPSRGVTTPSFGFRDPILSWGMRFDDGFWARVSTAIPIGDWKNFHGAGGLRIALAGGLERDWFGVSATLTVPLTYIPIFEGLGNVPTIGATGWIVMPWNLPGRLELQLGSSPVTLGERFTNFTVALRIVVVSSVGAFSFNEDLTAPLPDVVFSWDSRFDFACPTWLP
jgi:hypothetical protein